MITFYINPLSANSQYASFQDAEKAFLNVIKCIEYILPAVKSDRVNFVYDASVESRRLIPGSDFKAFIAAISDGSVRDRWYRYIKNNAVRADLTVAMEYEITPPDGVGGSIKGNASQDLIAGDSNLLSFGFDRFHEHVELVVNLLATNTSYNLSNSDRLTRLKSKLPLYAPNKKHQREPYFDRQRREYVSAMPLTDLDAQTLLLESIENGGDRWAYHYMRGEYYKFRLTLTHLGQSIYHGYVVDIDKVPSQIRTLLEPT